MADLMESVGAGWLILLGALFAAVLWWAFGAKRRRGGSPRRHRE